MVISRNYIRMQVHYFSKALNIYLRVDFNKEGGIVFNHKDQELSPRLSPRELSHWLDGYLAGCFGYGEGTQEVYQEHPVYRPQEGRQGTLGIIAESTTEEKPKTIQFLTYEKGRKLPLHNCKNCKSNLTQKGIGCGVLVHTPTKPFSSCLDDNGVLFNHPKHKQVIQVNCATCESNLEMMENVECRKY